MGGGTVRSELCRRILTKSILGGKGAVIITPATLNGAVMTVLITISELRGIGGSGVLILTPSGPLTVRRRTDFGSFVALPYASVANTVGPRREIGE